jgi:hypothetical protein
MIAFSFHCTESQELLQTLIGQKCYYSIASFEIKLNFNPKKSFQLSKIDLDKKSN